MATRIIRLAAAQARPQREWARGADLNRTPFVAAISSIVLAVSLLYASLSAVGSQPSIAAVGGPAPAPAPTLFGPP
jgi:hypothetical protein